MEKATTRSQSAEGRGDSKRKKSVQPCDDAGVGRKTAPAGTTVPAVIVGMDVGEKRVQLFEFDGDGVVSELRLATSAKKLLEHFENKPRCRVIVEVGPHTRWIAELLESAKHEVLVVDPRRVKLISGSLYKDDRVDAQTLAMLGKDAPGLLKTVGMRGLESQMVLTLVRARASAVRGRTRIINTIRGLLKPYGFIIPKKGQWSTFAAYLRANLDGGLLRIIEPLLALLETFNAQIAGYDSDVELVLPRHAPDAVHLTEITGVGALTVLYFVAVVGDPKRFAKNRDVGAYLGLCRRRQDSGDYRSELGITKAGDRLMRALLTNCAAYILGPFGKDCELRRWGLKKVGAGSRAEKKKAKIALARKLSVLMLTLWKTGRHYDPFRNTPDEAKKAA